jgi:hypothetical protein
MFDSTLGDASSGGFDAGAASLAEMIQAQRAALDAASNATANTNSMRAAAASNKNDCDINLRSCMAEKCGTNLTNCASDTDTIFGTKLDSCRQKTNCDANEFQLLSAEIKADRQSNIQIQLFNDILGCGQEYDNCITSQCGTTYARCLGKRDGDAAISKCANIANRCKSLDNGLQGRTTSVFATLRETAEKQISIDEEKLYSLRQQMKSLCTQMGAMFDERTLDCVYTVNFRAGNDDTVYASKKLYAGNTFNCTPDWFGIDITTFMENAMRTTREQKSATAAVTGTGLGMAVGGFTSGAFSRANETQQAAQTLKDAKSGKVTEVEPKKQKSESTEKPNETPSQKDDNANNKFTFKSPDEMLQGATTKKSSTNKMELPTTLQPTQKDNNPFNLEPLNKQ